MKKYISQSTHTSLVEKLGRLHRQWRAIVDAELLPLGLTHPRWTAIWKLWRMGENISQKHLADALEIELASLMRTLGQLEEQGLIQRHTCLEDKRVRLVNLTPEGIAIIRQMEARIVQVRTELLAGITPEELALFDSVIERIATNIHDKLSSTPLAP
ncbi:transcriptional regulator SlyA [Hydrogenovibrio marinus]|uniref:MarR family transcriptional regulator n=1 Tax=Hydrogenovibrio marinus TaxID=28885 RepID=A0A066ZNQ6_HYDMR|nr:transcriptional regulator SlyA [Hydrogenovibrio marinus]KDN95132.1 MarR family transcriptional regulator [Hydrogenovibrio marinus]